MPPRRKRSSAVPAPEQGLLCAPPSRPLLMAGIDEAGRGCLAGPVVAAAVILPERYDLPGLTDSKALSPARREHLAPLIRQCALAWGPVSYTHLDVYKRQAGYPARHAIQKPHVPARSLSLGIRKIPFHATGWRPPLPSAASRMPGSRRAV